MSTGRFSNQSSVIKIYGSRKKKPLPKKQVKETLSKKVIYSANGQAPAPCKDFCEIKVYEDHVTWRRWQIKNVSRGMTPSETTYLTNDFLDSDAAQVLIERFLGDDIYNMAIGSITKLWLPRLPIHILANIMSNLSAKEVCNLQQVSSTLRKRLQYDAVWKALLSRDFGLSVVKLPVEKRKNLKVAYKKEVLKQKENEIDWDNV